MIIDADLSELYVAYIKPVVDDSLSLTSTNPVQNKVITEALNTKLDSLNIKNGHGEGSFNQIQDLSSGIGTFDFTGKNANATAIDPTLTGNIPYGATGDFSASFGGKGAAQGKRSFAAGTTTIAKGNYSAAIGDNAVSLGADSLATGYATTAQGLASFTAGVETVTRDTEWIKPSSGGGGSGGSGSGTDVPTTNVRGQGAVAVGVKTLSSGYGSTATGIGTVSNGTGSFTAGVGTVAKDTGSVAVGANTEANSINTFAGGNSSVAGGSNSFAYGIGAKTLRDGEIALGRYNKTSPETLFSVGNGTSDTNRSNVIEITSDVGFTSNATNNIFTGLVTGVNAIFNGSLSSSHDITAPIIRAYNSPVMGTDVVRKKELDALIDRVSQLEKLLNQTGYNVMLVEQEEKDNGR